MSKIIVELPKDRTGVGTLCLVADSGSVAAGPFGALGCADRKCAADAGNPNANRRQLYGDTPQGTFAVVDVIKTGGDSLFTDDQYGPHGAIRLRPISGEAATAAAAGRTGIMVHGGEIGPDGKLRPTAGNIRLTNADMAALIQAIAMLSVSEGPPRICEVMECSKGSSRITHCSGIVSESDPPPGMAGDWHLDAILKTRVGSAFHSRDTETTRYVLKDQGHDREAHDRDNPGRETHDRASEGHDREAGHDRDVHDRDVNREPAGHDRQTENHDRDAHDRGA